MGPFLYLFIGLLSSSVLDSSARAIHCRKVLVAERVGRILENRARDMPWDWSKNKVKKFRQNKNEAFVVKNWLPATITGNSRQLWKSHCFGFASILSCTGLFPYMEFVFPKSVSDAYKKFGDEIIKTEENYACSFRLMIVCWARCVHFEPEICTLKQKAKCTFEDRRFGLTESHN